MRKSKLLLLGIVAALFGAMPSWAQETITENFDGDLPEGWVLNGDLSRNSDRAKSGKGIWTSGKSDKTDYLVTPKLKGSSTISFYARQYNKSSYAYIRLYAVDAEGKLTGEKLQEISMPKASSTPSWSQYTLTVPAGNQRVAIDFNYACLDDMTYTPAPAATEGPALSVSGDTDGALVFGMVEAGATKELLLENPGGESLTVKIETTGGFTATPATAEIPASGKQTISIAAPAVTANGTVTITPNPAVEGIDPVTINLSCVVKDPNKVFVDFADNALPEDWEATTSSDNYSWKFDEGFANYTGTDGALTTPAMIFEDGETLMFDAAGNNSWEPDYGATWAGSVTVQVSENGQTFTDLKSFTGIHYNEWQSCSVNVPAETKYVRFSVNRADIDNIYGGKIDNTPRPKLAVEGDDNGALDWGYSPVPAGSTKTVYVKNTGSADLNVTFTATQDFTLNAESATVKAGETFELIVGTPGHDAYWDGETGLLTITPAEETGLTPVTITLKSYYKAPEAVMSIDKTTVAFGKAYNDKTETITVSNTGDAELVAAISIETETAERFEVSAESVTVPAGESKTFDITYKYDGTLSGIFTATVKVTPEGKSATNIQVTANNKKAGVWTEDFEEGKIPNLWATTGWTVSQPYGKDSYMAGPGSSNTATLTTPRLKATAGETLTFMVIDAENETYFVKAEYSADEQKTWTLIDTYTAEGEKTFTAPADGEYFLRFTGYYTYVDNFEGFNILQKANDVQIAASSLPASGTQYEDYKASVTVKNVGTEAQTVVARLLIGGKELLVKEAELAVDAQAVIDLTVKPEEVVEEGKAVIEVTLKDVADFDALTVEQTVTIAGLELVEVKDAYEDETVNSFNYTGSKVNFQLDRKFNAGWNTIALPFDYSDIEGVFGAGAKLYTFNGVTESGSLAFYTVDAIVGGTPYVLYLPQAIEEPVLFKAVSYTVAGVTAASRGAASAKFQPTYNPVASDVLTGKYGVTADGQIRKAGATAKMNGFRAYFDVTIAEGESRPAPGLIEENVDASRLMTLDFTGQTTGISTVQTAANGRAVFNMQGQRVVNAAKGLYIVNGKKMVIK